MTGTEWDNFWRLRVHPDAQPEFQELAAMMKEALIASKPVMRKYHLPYADTLDIPLEDAFKVSAARCARVSYKTFDGALSTLEKDIELCEQLISSGHLSPFDHPATSDTTTQFDVSKTMDDPTLLKKFWDSPADHRHLWGWIPQRVAIETQMGWVGRRNSYDPLP
jgi:thymidylate synthase ThyX